MKIVYIDFGEARIVYGSAAAVALQGHETSVIQPYNISHVESSLREVEIGSDLETRRVSVKTTRVPRLFFHQQMKLAGCQNCENFLGVIASQDPEALIVGSRNWIVAKRAANKLGIPVLLWDPVAPGILKLSVLVRDGKVYSRLLTTPIGFAYLACIASLSDYVITHDVITTQIMKRLGIKHVETIWPTYSRFLGKDAYVDFLDREGSVRERQFSPSSRYVLSLMCLNPQSAVYETELKSLQFVRNVAQAIPDIDFVVICATIEDVQDRAEYEKTENLKLIGRVYSDADMSDLYRKALCVLCPYFIPGFSSRLLEAFFYGKPIVATTLINKYYGDLLPGRDIMFADTADSAAKAVKKLTSEEHCKKAFEEASHSFYQTHYSPVKHAENIERLLNYARSRTR